MVFQGLIILYRREDSERGISIVSLALTLPIVLILILSSVQLFVYYRAVAAVERAAGEAARTLAASLLPENLNISTHQQTEVRAKKNISTVSGGDTLGNVSLSFRQHGRLYEQAGGTSTKSVKLPFELSALKNGPDYLNKIPGVNYLPLVSTWTCLEAVNETTNSISNCGPPDKPDQFAGFLTYQLPNKLDFDGDGKEDIAFFYANPSGRDWWVLLSSTGTLFRDALSIDQGAFNQLAPKRTSALPCPADYDGDGKTDFCVAITRDNSIELRIAFSTLNLTTHRSFFLHDVDAKVALPVPGPWTDDDRDSFAVILLEGEDPANHLATYIWPPFFRTQKKLPSEVAYDFDDMPQRFASPQDKPLPGKNWRPAFGDHDGDGLLDIGWLTWGGGNQTTRVAGIEQGVSNAGNKPALEATLSPWSLFYPPSEESAGLYVVETNNHRISLISTGKDKTVNGQDKEEQYRLIAGLSGGKFSNQIPQPNPLTEWQEGALETPTTSKDNGCRTCYRGGKFSDESGSAAATALNTPKDVVSLGKGPLYIADYGNLRVRKVLPGSNEIVDGGNDEDMFTIVGGLSAPGVTCPAQSSENSGIGNRAVTWDEYAEDAQLAGIHPSCVAVRPISLALAPDGETLFIGDEGGVIFVLYPGNDGLFDMSADEKLSVIAGQYNRYAENNSSKSQLLGQPIRLSFYNDSRLGERLIVLIRHRLTKSQEKDKKAPEGEIIQIIPELRRFDFDLSGNMPRTKIKALLSSEKNAPSLRQAGLRFASEGIKLENPSDFALFQSGDAQDGEIGMFISTWWTDEISQTYDNSILRVSPNPNLKTFGDSPEVKEIMPGATVTALNNIHLNSWGKRAADFSAEHFIIPENVARPLSTLPVRPSAGVAVSPDQRFLYFSQTETGQVFAVALDADGDGLPDLSDPLNLSAQDPDLDGDGIPNDDDEFPYLPQAQIQAVGNYQTSSKHSFRPLDLYSDAVLWAKNPFSTLDAGGNYVDRIEWWLDRFAAPVAIPASDSSVPPPTEANPATVLNESTVAILAPLSALHSVPVWPGGFSNTSEYNSAGNKYRLAPIIMGSRSPALAEIKDVSSWNECSGWNLNDSENNDLASDGRPLSSCDRDITKAVYRDGRKVGTRRAHLAHWKGHWHPYANDETTQNELTFIDWDGDGIRNPALIELDRVLGRNRPLMMRIGNLSGMAPGSRGHICPGNFAIRSLKELTEVLTSRYRPPLSVLETQYDCNQDEIPFFTSSAAPYASIMTDTHAEWATTAITSLANYEGQKSERLDSAAGSLEAETFDTGPVAEVAYRTLENSAKVLRRHAAEKPFDANVILKMETEELATVEVSYILPLNTVLARLRGEEFITIKAKATRRIYGTAESAN